MVDFEIIREWVQKADDDFEFARVNFEERTAFFAQISFHFQQSAEKYLKTYIIAHELEFRKIHDLPALLKVCSSKDPSFDELRQDSEYLTTFYVETRYPVHWPTRFSQEEAEKAFQSAKRIQSFVKNKIGLSSN